MFYKKFVVWFQMIIWRSFGKQKENENKASASAKTLFFRQMNSLKIRAGAFVEKNYYTRKMSG